MPVFAALGATAPATEIGFARGRLVADLPDFQRWSFADGACPLTWRQGLKHDAAAVMELDREHDGEATLVRNKQGPSGRCRACLRLSLAQGDRPGRGPSRSRRDRAGR